MKANAVARVAANVIWPVAVLALPKCPLCLLPLLAFLGLAVDPGPVLDLIVIAFVGLWLALFLRTTKSHALRGVVLLAAALVIAGRVTELTDASWLGVALMLSMAVVRLFARERVCASGCAPSHQHER